jgi:hypothetical protein
MPTKGRAQSGLLFVVSIGLAYPVFWLLWDWVLASPLGFGDIRFGGDAPLIADGLIPVFLGQSAAALTTLASSGRPLRLRPALFAWILGHALTVTLVVTTAGLPSNQGWAHLRLDVTVGVGAESVWSEEHALAKPLAGSSAEVAVTEARPWWDGGPRVRCTTDREALGLALLGLLALPVEDLRARWKCTMERDYLFPRSWYRGTATTNGGADVPQ